MTLLIQCIICCILFTLMILPAVYKDPLNMIMSYPPEIRKRVQQLPQYKDCINQKERTHIARKIIGMLLFILLFAMLAYFSGCRNFSSVFFHVFIIFFSVNLFDLLILDFGVFCHSQKLRIPGTEDMERAYHDLWFHVKGAMKGTILGIIVALSAAVLVELIHTI